MTAVYALTTIGPTDEEEWPHTRTVGLFSSSNEAAKILEENQGDLNEAGCYPWAVIERINFGLYPCGDHEPRWFVYSARETWHEVAEMPEAMTTLIKSLSWNPEQIVGWASIG